VLAMADSSSDELL